MTVPPFSISRAGDARRAILVAICLVAVTGGRAQGAPPLLTEDPGTPGDGNWEINVAHSQERRAGETVARWPVLDLNYGWGERVQLKLESAQLAQTPAGEARRNGSSRLHTGLKWRFCDEELAGVAMAVFPQAEFRVPRSSSSRRGLVPDENSFALPLEFQRQFGIAVVSVELGHVANSKSAAGWFHGISAVRQITTRLTLALELHGETDRPCARSSLLANACAHVKLTDRTGLVFAFGRDLHNHHAPRATVSYLGVQFLPSFRRLVLAGR